MKTSWLVLFEGGVAPPSYGPADAGPAVFHIAYSGVIVDDQTGSVIYWFEGGSFTR